MWERKWLLTPSGKSKTKSMHRIHLLWFKVVYQKDKPYDTHQGIPYIKPNSAGSSKATPPDKRQHPPRIYRPRNSVLAGSSKANFRRRDYIHRAYTNLQERIKMVNEYVFINKMSIPTIVQNWISKEGVDQATNQKYSKWTVVTHKQTNTKSP